MEYDDTTTNNKENSDGDDNCYDTNYKDDNDLDRCYWEDDYNDIDNRKNDESLFVSNTSTATITTTTAISIAISTSTSTILQYFQQCIF